MIYYLGGYKDEGAVLVFGILMGGVEVDGRAVKLCRDDMMYSSGGIRMYWRGLRYVWLSSKLPRTVKSCPLADPSYTSFRYN